MLAPLWTLGARGHALVWAAFVLCALLYAWCAVAAYRIARAMVGIDATRGAREAVGIGAGAIVVSIAAFAWTALSGMEVALASASLLTIIAVLVARSTALSSASSSAS